MEKQKIKCKFCGKENYTKQGYRKTLNRGKIQKYKCLDCGKYFTNDDGFYRMRNSDKKITMAVDMYLSNLSSRKMRNQFKRHFDFNISHQTILEWVRKYVRKVKKFIDKLRFNLSGKFYADETEIKRRKNNDIFWCSVDWETRYINAFLYSNKPQNCNDARKFLRKIQKSGKVRYVQTDAGVFYPKAFKRVFYTRYKKDKVEHRIVNTSKTGKYNVRIETLFSKIKDRVHDFRSLKALWSSPILLIGLVIQHNFIEKHSTTGKIPCELAGQNLNLGENRWLSLIRLSS